MVVEVVPEGKKFGHLVSVVKSMFLNLALFEVSLIVCPSSSRGREEVSEDSMDGLQ